MTNPDSLTITSTDSLMMLLDAGQKNGARFQFNRVAKPAGLYNLAIQPADGSISHQPVMMSPEMLVAVKRYSRKHPNLLTFAPQEISGKLPTDYDDYQQVLRKMEPLLGLRKEENEAQEVKTSTVPRPKIGSEEEKQIETMRAKIFAQVLIGNEEVCKIIDTEIGGNDKKFNDVDLNRLQTADSAQLYQIATTMLERGVVKPITTKEPKAPLATPAEGTKAQDKGQDTVIPY